MKRVPFPMIQAAKEFEPEAVAFVLRHFERFIASRCLSGCPDEYGNVRSYVDDDLRYQAVIAVFKAISGFHFREPSDDFIL